MNRRFKKIFRPDAVRLQSGLEELREFMHSFLKMILSGLKVQAAQFG